VAGSGYMLVRQPDHGTSEASSATLAADEPSVFGELRHATDTSDFRHMPSTEWQTMPEHMWHPTLHDTGGPHTVGISTAG
jgi:hypothetical protein